jgi:hypothetical protein
MWIESDGIGLLNSLHQTTVLVRKKNCRAVSSIDGHDQFGRDRRRTFGS